MSIPECFLGFHKNVKAYKCNNGLNNHHLYRPPIITTLKREHMLLRMVVRPDIVNGEEKTVEEMTKRRRGDGGKAAGPWWPQLFVRNDALNIYLKNGQVFIAENPARLKRNLPEATDEKPEDDCGSSVPPAIQSKSFATGMYKALIVVYIYCVSDALVGCNRSYD